MSDPTFREAIEKLSNISIRIDGSDRTQMMLEQAGLEEYRYLRDNLHALLWRGLCMEENSHPG